MGCGPRKAGSTPPRATQKLFALSITGDARSLGIPEGNFGPYLQGTKEAGVEQKTPRLLEEEKEMAMTDTIPPL